MRKILFIFIATLILGLAVYFAFIYYVPFSEGYRSGELIKFSNKGVMVKTWEGEISQGISGAQIFSFSVQDSQQEVIEKLKNFQGFKFWRKSSWRLYSKLNGSNCLCLR